MKAWLKGGLFVLVIAVVILFFYSDYLFFSSDYNLNVFLSIISLGVLIISGIIIGFLHDRIKLKSYKAIYLFYLISFILIILFLLNFMPWGDWEIFNFQTFLFLAFPIISLIFSGIFWIFEKKQFESNFMVYSSFYLSVFAIFVIIIISLLSITAEGESLLAAYVMILFSYFLWGLSFIFLIIGFIITKLKSKNKKEIIIKK